MSPEFRKHPARAIAGSVAGAIRFLTKAIMLGHVSGIPETSGKGLETSNAGI
jgi:hypothetical protein